MLKREAVDVSTSTVISPPPPSQTFEGMPFTSVLERPLPVKDHHARVTTTPSTAIPARIRIRFIEEPPQSDFSPILRRGHRRHKWIRPEALHVDGKLDRDSSNGRI